MNLLLCNYWFKPRRLTQLIITGRNASTRKLTVLTHASVRTHLTELNVKCLISKINMEDLDLKMG